MVDKKLQNMLDFWLRAKEATQDPRLGPMRAVNGHLGLEGFTDAEVLAMDLERKTERARFYAAYLRRWGWLTPRQRFFWRVAEWLGCSYFDAFQDGWHANGR